MATCEELLEREDVQAAIVAAKASPAHAGKRFRPIDTPAGFVIIKSPSKAQWNMMRAIAWDDDKANSSKAMESLIMGILVHPDRGEIARISEDYVGIWDNPAIVKEV